MLMGESGSCKLAQTPKHKRKRVCPGEFVAARARRNISKITSLQLCSGLSISAIHVSWKGLRMGVCGGKPYALIYCLLGFS